MVSDGSMGRFDPLWGDLMPPAIGTQHQLGRRRRMRKGGGGCAVSELKLGLFLCEIAVSYGSVSVCNRRGPNKGPTASLKSERKGA